MIGNDDSLSGGVIGGTTLLAANWLFVRLTYRSRTARLVLEGRPLVLLEHGRPVHAALRREAITLEELQAAALERGFEELDEVDLVVLMTNGHLAVMGRQAADRWRDRHEAEAAAGGA
jgi:uncharacterized membrane protein YcaP (DUF421 family)